MEQPVGSKTILLVDDDALMLSVFAEAVAIITGYQVHSAENGEQGLEMAIELHPDCVVIDVKMPALNGYQLVRALRGDPATADIPLIILTAMAQDKDRLIGLASGTDRYVTKPVKPSELVVIIQEVLRLDQNDYAERLRELADQPPLPFERK